MSIFLFGEFLKESSNEKTSQEIINYIKLITPSESDVPDYFFSLIRKSNMKFRKERVSIEEILKKDLDLKDYVMSGEERYGEQGESEHEPHWEELDNPVVIFKDTVVDGYSRISTKYHSGEKFVDAYVSF